MYKLTDSNFVIRITDNAVIPINDSNIDYIKYKKWLDDGNIPEPAHSEEDIISKQIEAIKQKANADIVAIIPIEKQINALSRAVELVLRKAEGTIIHPDEDIELDLIKDKWSLIKKIRKDSNDLENTLRSK